MHLQCTLANGLAAVYVNNRYAGTLWCAPYRLDISPYVKKGRNQLRIEVVNSLYNRMVGDAVHPDRQTYTQAVPPIVTAETPLVPSGVVGRVNLLF